MFTVQNCFYNTNLIYKCPSRSQEHRRALNI